MEFFFGQIDGNLCNFDEEESAHLVRVLRHKVGDEVNVVDGVGTMYLCRLTDPSPKGALAEVLESFPRWGSHPYHLTLGVCPTKNNDRYEWFAEKATEVGVDRIVPLIGDRSERKVFKTGRLRRILVSAMKQSLKSALPEVVEPLTVKSFLEEFEDPGALRLIAYCFEGETGRVSVKSALADYDGDRVVVLIGPEGDFSPQEAALAVSKGFIPIHLGASRLRTETAAVTAAEAVYFRYME